MSFAGTFGRERSCECWSNSSSVSYGWLVKRMIKSRGEPTVFSQSSMNLQH